MGRSLVSGFWKRFRAFQEEPDQESAWLEKLSERDLALLRQLPKDEQAWLVKNEFRPESFILYQFSGKGPGEREKYVSDGRAWRRLQQTNDFSPGAFVWNKLVFHRVLEKAAPPVLFPKLKGVIRRGQLIAADPPYSATSLGAIFQETEALVVKPIENRRGTHVQFLTKDEFLAKTDGVPIREITEIIPASKRHELIVVDRVDQADYAAQISPVSSNTIRIVCMRRPFGREVFIPFAVHRFGTRETAPLDNFSQGGLSCAIDMATGRLGPGVMHPSRTDLSLCWYPSHPDTGQRLEGLTIPHWQELLKNVTELMDIFPDLEFVGWDMLPTEDGWCVIEGNAFMDVDLLQVHEAILADCRVKEFVAYHCP